MLSETTVRPRAIVRAQLLLIAIGVLIVISTVIYYAVVTADARAQTRTLIDDAWIAHGRTVSAKDLSVERRAWLLAIEDPSFDRHRGVDLSTPGAAMTTIAQSLVKLVYFPEGFKPGIAKIRQTLIAQYPLDATISKEEQLSLFLSVAYFGHNRGAAVNGFDHAANIFLDKPFSQRVHRSCRYATSPKCVYPAHRRACGSG